MTSHLRINLQCIEKEFEYIKIKRNKRQLQTTIVVSDNSQSLKDQDGKDSSYSNLMHFART